MLLFHNCLFAFVCGCWLTAPVLTLLKTINKSSIKSLGHQRRMAAVIFYHFYWSRGFCDSYHCLPGHRCTEGQNFAFFCTFSIHDKWLKHKSDPQQQQPKRICSKGEAGGGTTLNQLLVFYRRWFMLTVGSPWSAFLWRDFFSEDSTAFMWACQWCLLGKGPVFPQNKMT